LLQVLNSLDPTRDQRDLARLRSVACRAAGLWMDTTPFSRWVRLGDFAVRAGLRHHLGLPYLPQNAHSMVCACKRRVQVADYDHFMVCSTQSARHQLHEFTGGAIRGAIGSAGVASSREPRVHDLPGGDQARHAQHAGARMDIVVLLDPEGIVALDQSIIHPAADSYSAEAALREGAAAEKRDASKRAAYATVDPHGYHFVPFTVESYGRIGKPGMQFLRKLAQVASQAPGVQGFDKGRFMEMALRRISVALCNGVAMMCRVGAQRFAAGVGLNYDPGLSDPVDDASV